MFCAKCGANVEQGKPFCGACGQPVTGYAVGQAAASAAGVAPSAAVPGYAMPGNLPVPEAQANIGYAGFWLRLVAAIIDGIVLAIPLMPVFFLVFIDMFRHAQDFQGRQDPTALMTVMGPKIVLILFISAIASWLYWGLFESSAWQATRAKKPWGLSLRISKVDGSVLAARAGDFGRVAE